MLEHIIVPAYTTSDLLLMSWWQSNGTILDILDELCEVGMADLYMQGRYNNLYY